MRPRVAYVTHSGSAVPDPDLAVALPALEHAGLDVDVLAWDTDTVWDDFDLVLVRSAWDHVARRQEFLRWARSVETRTVLANPALTLARNTDRTYLRDLRHQGVPVVDTVWLEPGDDPTRCAAQIRARGWGSTVVKPNIGTGGIGEQMVHGAQESARVAQRLAAQGHVAIIQPSPPVAERVSELCVVLLDGRVSHAVSRAPGDIDEVVEVQEQIADLALAIADAAQVGEHLLYARVDLVRDGDDWLLVGFEATDPCLFLAAAPAAAETLGSAVRRWIMPDAQAADFLVGSG